MFIEDFEDVQEELNELGWDYENMGSMTGFEAELLYTCVILLQKIKNLQEQLDEVVDGPEYC